MIIFTKYEKDFLQLYEIYHFSLPAFYIENDDMENKTPGKIVIHAKIIQHLPAFIQLMLNFKLLTG